MKPSVTKSLLPTFVPSTPDPRVRRRNRPQPSVRTLLVQAMSMQDQDWIKTLEDGRKVKFIYQELPAEGAFITAQIAGNEVVYSVVLTKAEKPLSREDVESHFKGELAKK
jgi:hypothetical protein